MGLLRPYKKRDEATVEPEPVLDAAPAAGRGRKSGPTPTRKQAEAARRERLHPTLTKKEVRARQTQANREQRLAAMSERDNVPGRALVRNWVDSRRSVGEFLMPVLLLILVLTLAQQWWAYATISSMVLMYGFLLITAVDLFIMWRGYRKLHEERLPDVPRRGLAMYACNRAIQMRRLRMPPPVVERGEAV